MNEFLKTFHSLLTYSSSIRGGSLSSTCVDGRQGPGSCSFAGRAARTQPPLSVNLNLGASDGKKQGVPCRPFGEDGQWWQLCNFC